MTNLGILIRVLLSNIKSRFLIELGRKEFILCRTACLVNDSLADINKNYLILNSQKLRIDFLIEYKSTTDYTILSKLETFRRIARNIKRKDIKYIVLKSLYYWFPNRSPKIIILDNYSELTDQEFILGKTKFYCGYSDLENPRKLISKGKLDLKEFPNMMNRLLNFLNLKVPGTKIIYFIFPDKLEKRKEYIERRMCILNSIKNLERENSLFTYIQIPDEIIEPREGDDFVYHYNKEVYSFINGKLKTILKWQ